MSGVVESTAGCGCVVLSESDAVSCASSAFYTGISAPSCLALRFRSLVGTCCVNVSGANPA